MKTLYSAAVIFCICLTGLTPGIQSALTTTQAEVMKTETQEHDIRAFMRIDLGIEHWEQGRDVIDITGDVVLIANLYGDHVLTGNIRVNRAGLEGIEQRLRTLIHEFASVPSSPRMPDESVVLLSIGTFGGGVESVAIAYNRFAASTHGAELLVIIDKWKRAVFGSPAPDSKEER